MHALALHQLDVVQPERRAQRGHRVGEARLVHGYDVGVALADYCLARGGHGLLGAVVGKEVLALVEDGRVARVDVLGHVLLLAHDAPAEGDSAPQLVVDGKHHALVEAVGGAAAAVHGKVGRHDLSRREALLPQVRHQGATAGGVAQAPAAADVAAKAAPGKVGSRLGGALRAAAHEHGRVEGLGLGQALDEAVPARAALAAALLGELYARAVRQVADGIGKLEVLALLHVAKDVAALAAAKAVPQARVGVDLEGGVLLAVEGAAAPELLASLAELHGLGHQGDEVRCLADALLVLVGDHAAPPPMTLPSPRDRAVQPMLPRTVRSSSSRDEKDLESRSHRTKVTCATRP